MEKFQQKLLFGSRGEDVEGDAAKQDLGDLPPGVQQVPLRHDVLLTRVPLHGVAQDAEIANVKDSKTEQRTFPQLAGK